MHRQVNAIQTCIFKEEDKKYTRCNLKTTNLLDCLFIGVCAVIRSNMVCYYENTPIKIPGILKILL